MRLEVPEPGTLIGKKKTLSTRAWVKRAVKENRKFYVSLSNPLY